MELAPDFDEFVGSLLAHGVEFLIVGAYALALHGAPRFTGDLDVFVRPTQDNAEKLLTAIREFGFPVDHLTAQDIVDERRLIEMGVAPVQIHVMSAISGVPWAEAWADHVVARCGSSDVPIIGRASFIKNKRSAGRLKDLADIEAIGGEQAPK